MSTTLPNLDAFPADRRAKRRFILWKREVRDGKPTKVPYQATGRPASTTSPSQWSTFDDALAAWRAAPKEYSGIGYVFGKSDGEVGIDLDDCRNAETGEIQPWARKIIDDLNSYAEVSPSGTGVKIWVEGTLPTDQTGKKRKYETGAIELYQRGRYFAVTGNTAGLDAKPVAERTAEITALWAKVFGGSPATSIEPATDAEACWARLEKMPDSVSGDRGHDRLLAVHCEILRHGITGDEAWALIHRFNDEKCDPPWSQAARNPFRRHAAASGMLAS